MIYVFSRNHHLAAQVGGGEQQTGGREQMFQTHFGDFINKNKINSVSKHTEIIEEDHSGH